jgi:hypothetical protein
MHKIFFLFLIHNFHRFSDFPGFKSLANFLNQCMYHRNHPTILGVRDHKVAEPSASLGDVSHQRRSLECRIDLIGPQVD